MVEIILKYSDYPEYYDALEYAVMHKDMLIIDMLASSGYGYIYVIELAARLRDIDSLLLLLRCYLIK